MQNSDDFESGYLHLLNRERLTRSVKVDLNGHWVSRRKHTSYAGPDGKRKVLTVRKALYELAKGEYCNWGDSPRPICGHKECVNPDHMHVMSHGDAVSEGRAGEGRKHVPHETITAIREASILPDPPQIKVVADYYNVTRQTVHNYLRCTSCHKERGVGLFDKDKKHFLCEPCHTKASSQQLQLLDDKEAISYLREMYRNTKSVKTVMKDAGIMFEVLEPILLCERCNTRYGTEYDNDTFKCTGCP